MQNAKDFLSAKDYDDSLLTAGATKNFQTDIPNSERPFELDSRLSALKWTTYADTPLTDMKKIVLHVTWQENDEQKDMQLSFLKKEESI